MERMINESLKINTVIPLTHVNHFQIRWEINEHALLHLDGELSYEEAVACQSGNISGSSLEVWYKDSRQEQVLFHGLIKKTEFLWDGGVSRIRLEAVSATWKLDQGRTSRSFQDQEMTYARLVRQIADASGAEVVISCGTESRLKGALIQYRETDWEFLKRISSHLHRFLVCDVETGRPAFWFGMRRGEQVTIISDRREESRFDALSGRSGYIIHSREVYNLCDRSTWMGVSVAVSGRIAEFQGGDLLFTYYLDTEIPFSREMQYNEQFTGRGFYGKVREVSGEMVRVQLDMDGEKESPLYWYPWRPDTGNIMYAMPETGSPVLLTMPSHDEREAEVRICLHKNGTKDSREKEYQNRCLNIRDDSILRLYPDKLELSKSGDEHVLAIEDGTGIRLETGNSLRLEARENIICRGNRVDVKASDEISGVVGQEMMENGVYG